MFRRDKLSYRGRECTASWVSLDPHLLRSRERALLMPVAQEMDVGADSLQRGSGVRSQVFPDSQAICPQPPGSSISGCFFTGLM